MKANSAEEVDGALAIRKFDSCIKQMNPCKSFLYSEDLCSLVRLQMAQIIKNIITSLLTVIVTDHAEAEMEYQDLEHLYLTNPEENNTMPGISNIRLISDHSENESGDFGFEITDGIRMSETVVDFKEVRSFEDFDILVNGLVINCELSKHLQMKYYELCCSQKCFLHENFIEGLNCKLIAGIISETINIADAIRASKVTTSYDNFTTWEKTLKAFLGLGMKVDFLLARLEQLINLSAKSERHKKARLEKDNAEDEMRILEAKISGVEETMNRLDVVVETLEVNAENLELRFQELAKAPW